MAVDTDANINDVILLEALGGNSSVKMKSVVATIQKEQDAIIRNRTAYNLIVDGRAGSGKTVIAMHRLAWLLYNYKTLDSDRGMILSPNSIFGDYISDVLPELEENSVPEKEFDMQRDILDKIAETQKTGKRHFIIIVAEGVGHAQEIANEIQARTGIDSRATILGHVQRGGSPTLRDRVNASAMGYHAVCLLEQGKYNRIVGMKGEKLVDYPVDEALEMTKTLDPVLLDVCNTISI